MPSNLEGEMFLILMTVIGLTLACFAGVFVGAACNQSLGRAVTFGLDSIIIMLYCIAYTIMRKK